MTDMAEFIALLKRAGIPHTIDEGNLSVRKDKDPLIAHMIEVDNNIEGLGYSNFCSDWFFDKDQKLISVAHWER